MFRRKWFAIWVPLALVLGLLPQFAFAQQNISSTIQVSAPSSGTPAVANEFTTDVQVSVDITGTGLVGVDFYLGYNATVEPVDVDGATPGVQSAQILNDFFNSGVTSAANEAILSPGVIAPNLSMPGRTCPQGRYPCLHLSVAGFTAQTKRSGTLARLRWRGTSAGATSFAVLNPVTVTPYPQPPRTVFTDADGYVIPITSYSAANFDVAPQPGRIIGIVSRQGVPPNVPNTGTQGCTRIDVRESVPGSQVLRSGMTIATTSPVTVPQSINTPGGYAVTVSSGAGNYTVMASYPGYLSAQKTGVLTNGTDVNIGTARLYGGDVNGDGAINILDIVLIIGNLNLQSQPIRSSLQACGSVQGIEGEPSMIPPVDSVLDINDDGIVDISDLSIAAGNFGKTGPTIWAP